MIMLSNLGIIILNYNSWSLTINAINCIRQYFSEVKIVIVDNCSTDNSAELLKKEYRSAKETYVIVNKINSGYASGNNVGIRFAKDLGLDSVLIMNPDILIPNSEVIIKLYESLQSNRNIGAITAQTIHNGEFRQPNECAWHFLNKRNMFFGGTVLKCFSPSAKYKVLPAAENDIAYVDVVQGCFFMSRLDNLYKVGLLDENTFLYCEESILAKKYSKVGLKNAVYVKGVIYHNHQEKEKSIIKPQAKIFDIRCFHESRKYYIRKYSGENKFFIFLSTSFLNVDYFIKRMVLCLKSRIA